MIEFIVVSGEPNAQRRACKDCRHLRGAVALWCMSDDAHALRHTRIPGVRECPFWEPMRKRHELPVLAQMFYPILLQYKSVRL